MRLSFRLDEDSTEVWARLRERHKGKTDAYIFKELLRLEGFRLQGNTKDDRLARLEEGQKRIVELLVDKKRDFVVMRSALNDLVGVIKESTTNLTEGIKSLAQKEEDTDHG